MDDFLEIVDELSYHFNNNSDEKEYQKSIEVCFKILNWKKTNSSLKSQLVIPIGNNKSIKPDIVLEKNGYLLPIEVKKPKNTQTNRQIEQLTSYMRLLQSKVGMFIGNNIQLYYDFSESGKQEPVCVFKVEISDKDTNGEKFCELFLYDNFNKENLVNFCQKRYKEIQSLNDLDKRLNDMTTENLKEILKDYLTKEGFDINAINTKLEQFNITIDNTQTRKQEREVVKYKPVNHIDESKVRDNTKFSFDSIAFYNKRQFVLSIVRDYIQKHPTITFEKLHAAFPDKIHSSLGVIKLYKEIQNKMKSHPDIKRRYFLKQSEIIRLTDGNDIVVCNQWGVLFPNFLKQAELLGYKIYSNQPYKY